jgi:hypothetical protein
LCLILAAWTAALAAPAFAQAGGVAMRVQTVVPGARQLAGSPAAFNMIAFKGRGAISFRVHRLHGTWSPWRTADDDPAWTGTSNAYQVRSSGRVRVYELWSPVTGAPVRRLADAGSPAIVARSGWKADEEIVRGKPAYAPSVKLAIIHHTAGTNTYTPAEAAAIVRGIETYHVEGNGWNDIGYNFLVDRFGNVYEGRAGGIDKNVIGAHSEGFNTGTVGIALIGNFQSTSPPKAMQDALVKLLAWRLDVAHVDPLSTVAYVSGGNAKFRAGKVVTLRAISGHRDTGPSECPGADAYAQLPGIAKRVSTTGLPKLYAPTAVGALGGPIRFQARLSAVLPWSVTVADQQGKTLATGTGRGATVDWTWSSNMTGTGAYTWTISAPGLRAATGTLGIPHVVPPVSPPALTAVSATLTNLSFTLAAAAQVTAQVHDASGAVVATVLDGKRSAGANTVAWDGTSLPAGAYRLAVTATAAGKSVTKWADLVVDRTVSAFSVAPGDAGTTAFSITLAAAATVKLEVDRGDAIVAEVFAGDLPAGAVTISWDRSGFGAPLAPGSYTAVLTVTGALGAVPHSIPLVLG